MFPDFIEAGPDLGGLGFLPLGFEAYQQAMERPAIGRTTGSATLRAARRRRVLIPVREVTKCNAAETASGRAIECPTGCGWNTACSFPSPLAQADAHVGKCEIEQQTVPVANY
jgi:hypothetical protein